MKISDRNTVFKIDGVEMTVSEIIAVLKKIPSYQIAEIFGKKGALIPREGRMLVIRELLSEEVAKIRIKHINLSDELNYRLNWFDTYTEFQLTQLIGIFDGEKRALTNAYEEDIWLLLLQVANEMGVSDQELAHLISTAKKLPTVALESARDFNKGIDPLFADKVGEMDGQVVPVFRDTLSNSSTLVELRDLATKYDINIPRRLKKEELIQILLADLPEDKKTEGIEEELKKKSVVQLQRFAKENKINASVELKKDDIIQYIMDNFKFDTTVKTRLIEIPEDLELPSRYLVLNETDHTLEEAPVEEPVVEETPVVEEPVVEEAPVEETPVVEETVAEETTVEETTTETTETYTSDDIVGLTDAINSLREEVSKLLEEEEDRTQPTTVVAATDNSHILMEQILKLQDEVNELREEMHAKPEPEEGVTEVVPIVVNAFKVDSNVKRVKPEVTNSTKKVSEGTGISPEVQAYVEKEQKFQRDYNKVYGPHPVRKFFKVFFTILLVLLILAAIAFIGGAVYYLVTNTAPESGFLKTVWDFYNGFLGSLKN